MSELRDDLVLVRTEAGDSAARRPRRIASSRARAALLLLDGVLTIGELKRRFGDSLEVEAAMEELLAEGLVADRDESPSGADAATSIDARSDSLVQTAATEEGNGPPTELPTGKARSGSGEGPASDLRIEPSLRTNTVFPDDDLPPPTESGTPRPEEPKEPSRAVLAADRARYHFVRTMRGFGYLVLATLAVALFALAFKLPEWYRGEIESHARGVGGQTLRIDSLGVAWKRGPVLLLEGISFVDDESVGIASVAVAPDWYELMSRGRLSTRLDIDGLRGRPSALRNLLARLDLDSLSTGRISFEGLRVELAEGMAPIFAGEASVSGGYVGTLSLRDESDLVRIRVDGLDAMPLKVSMAASGWTSPLLDKLKFEQMQMDGELLDDQLRLTDMRAAAQGGRYSATGTLLWNPTPSFDGMLWLDGVQLERLLLSVLPGARAEGSISGRFKLTSSAQTTSGLAANARIDGDFKVVRGNLGSADLGGVLRERGGGTVQGGMTRFDTVRGHLRTSAELITVDIRQLDAGGLDAVGTLRLPADGTVNGRIQGSVRAGERQLSLPIEVSGSVAAPALRLRPEAPATPETSAQASGE